MPKLFRCIVTIIIIIIIIIIVDCIDVKKYCNLAIILA